MDLQRMVGGAALAELRSLRDVTEAAGGESRGPIAIVATVGGVYAMAAPTRRSRTVKEWLQFVIPARLTNDFLGDAKTVSADRPA